MQFHNEQPFCFCFSSQRECNRFFVLTAVLFKCPQIYRQKKKEKTSVQMLADDNEKKTPPQLAYKRLAERHL